MNTLNELNADISTNEDMNGGYLQANYWIMEQLLGDDNLEDALSGSLDILLKKLDSEAGIVWLLDKEEERLHPVAFRGPVDITGVSIEYGTGVEATVVRTGEVSVIENSEDASSNESTVFDGNGFKTKNMLCAPLNDTKKVIGCVQIINKKNDEPYDEEDIKLCKRMAALAAITIGDEGFSLEQAEEKEVLVSLHDVIKEFNNPTGVSRVLKGINLNIYKGELLVVLGESGCGKSTMMNIIGGMDSLTDGTLMVEGVDYSNPTDEELTWYRRDYIGFIFQSYNLMPNLSAEENLQFIAEVCENPMDPLDALEKVGLKDKAKSFPSMLSGGQQQRIAIARALVKNPKLILADEPTAALDHDTSVEVLSAIEDIVKKNNTTVIMVTHNPEIGKMADRIVKLRRGRVFSIRKNLNPLSARELDW